MRLRMELQPGSVPETLDGSTPGQTDSSGPFSCAAARLTLSHSLAWRPRLSHLKTSPAHCQEELLPYSLVSATPQGM